VLVGDRKRVAVDAVARAEVALEVGGPEVVGLRGGRRDDTGMLVVAATPAFLDEAAAGQEIAGGADGGPVQGGLPRPQPGQELSGPQLGCCLRAAQITAATSGVMRCGH